MKSAITFLQITLLFFGCCVSKTWAQRPPTSEPSTVVDLSNVDLTKFSNKVYEFSAQPTGKCCVVRNDHDHNIVIIYKVLPNNQEIPQPINPCKTTVQLCDCGLSLRNNDCGYKLRVYSKKNGQWKYHEITPKRGEHYKLIQEDGIWYFVED